MGKRAQATEIRPFSFNALEGAPAAGEGWKEFRLPELGGDGPRSGRPSPKIIRAEREAASRAQFQMDSLVRDLRGLSAQEKDDLESRIGAEVEKKLQLMREDAYRQGLEAGRAEGAAAALDEGRAAQEAQYAEMTTLVNSVREQCAAQVEAYRNEVLEAAKRLVKWMVLKEIHADQDYLGRLLEKLILEMGQRHNLLVRANPDDFASMPGVLAELEKRLGALTNVRLEPDPEMKGRGLVVESENGIIDGTPDAMFQTLDKLFASLETHDG